MLSNQLNPAQLMMGYLSKEQGKLSDKIKSSDFSKTLEKERSGLQQAGTHKDSKLSEELAHAQDNPLAAMYQQQPLINLPVSNFVPTSERNTLSLIDKAKQAAESDTKTTPRLRRSSDVKRSVQSSMEKAKENLVFTNSRAVERIAAQLQLPAAEARKAFKSTSDGQGHLSCKELLTILDRQQNSNQQTSGQIRIVSRDVQDLLDSSQQLQEDSGIQKLQLKAKSSGYYTPNEFKDLLNRMVRQIAGSGATGQSSASGSTQTTTSSTATGTDQGASSHAPVSPGQVQSLAATVVPSFSKQIASKGPGDKEDYSPTILSDAKKVTASNAKQAQKAKDEVRSSRPATGAVATEITTGTGSATRQADVVTLSTQEPFSTDSAAWHLESTTVKSISLATGESIQNAGQAEGARTVEAAPSRAQSQPVSQSSSPDPAATNKVLPETHPENAMGSGIEGQTVVRTAKAESSQVENSTGTFQSLFESTSEEPRVIPSRETGNPSAQNGKGPQEQTYSSFESRELPNGIGQQVAANEALQTGTAGDTETTAAPSTVSDTANNQGGSSLSPVLSEQIRISAAGSVPSPSSKSTPKIAGDQVAGDQIAGDQGSDLPASPSVAKDAATSIPQSPLSTNEKAASPASETSNATSPSTPEPLQGSTTVKPEGASVKSASLDSGKAPQKAGATRATQQAEAAPSQGQPVSATSDATSPSTTEPLQGSTTVKSEGASVKSASLDSGKAPQKAGATQAPQQAEAAPSQGQPVSAAQLTATDFTVMDKIYQAVNAQGASVSGTEGQAVAGKAGTEAGQVDNSSGAGRDVSEAVSEEPRIMGSQGAGNLSANTGKGMKEQGFNSFGSNETASPLEAVALKGDSTRSVQGVFQVTPILNGANESPLSGSLSMQGSNWPQELAQKFQEMTQQKQNQITLELEPEHLGKILLKIETRQNHVNAWVSTENQQVKTILTQDTSLLRQHLEEQGLTLGQLSVDLQQGKGHSQSARQLSSGRKQAAKAPGIQAMERPAITATQVFDRSASGEQRINLFA